MARSKPVTNITFVDPPPIGTALTRGRSTWIVVANGTYEFKADGFQPVIHWERRVDGVVRFTRLSFDPREVLGEPLA